MNWTRKTNLGARDKCKGVNLNLEVDTVVNLSVETDAGVNLSMEEVVARGWGEIPDIPHRAFLCPQISFVKVSCTRRRPPLHTGRLPVFRRRASE